MLEQYFESSYHDHVLYLRHFNPGIVNCNICKYLITNAYSCHTCNFDICLSCKQNEQESDNLLSLNTQIHEHELYKSKHIFKQRTFQCDICGLYINKCWSCSQCKFSLCYRCRVIPTYTTNLQKCINGCQIL